MISAQFSVDDSIEQIAHAIPFGTTIDLAIINTAGIDYAEWEIVGQSHSATTATITPSSLGLTATFQFPLDPGVDWSVLLRCKANGGRGANGSINNNLFAYAVIGTTAHGPIVPFAANEGFARNPVAGWCEDLNNKTALATPSTAGLMSAAQVATLNAAVLSKAHGRQETDVALSTNSETILIPSIAIGGLDASSTYLFTVGARLAVHRTGVPTTCGYLDIVAYGYVQSDSSGGVGTTLRILGSTPDQSKLPTVIATATAAITDNVDYDFRITATRSTDIAMVVDSVEYWISSLDKLTVS